MRAAVSVLGVALALSGCAEPAPSGAPGASGQAVTSFDGRYAGTRESQARPSYDSGEVRAVIAGGRMELEVIPEREGWIVLRGPVGANGEVRQWAASWETGAAPSTFSLPVA